MLLKLFSGDTRSPTRSAPHTLAAASITSSNKRARFSIDPP